MVSFFRKIINKINQESIGTTALVVSFFGVLSRILGFLRDRILIYYFGVGDTLDSYYAAFKLPDFIFELLVAGVLGAALIPVFSDILGNSKDVKRAWRCANGVFVVLVIVFSFLSLMCMIFAPQLILVIVPGFPAEKMAQTVILTRIMLLSPIFFAGSTVLGNFLISLKKMLVYSMAQLLYNIGIIFGIIFFAPYFANNMGLAFGVILGAFLYFLVYFLAIKSMGLELTFSLSVLKKNLDALRVFKLMLPRLIGSGFDQISPFLITPFISTLVSGSLSIFNLASKIETAIVGLIGFPFALASFTALTENYSQGNYTKFSFIFSKTLRRISYYVIPLSFIIFILKEQIIRVAYGTRNFDLSDTKTTSLVLGILCISLFAQSLNPLLIRGFFAMQDTKTPLYIGLISQALNIIIIFLLIQEYKIFSIAIAFSVTEVFDAITMFILLSRKNSEIKYFKVLETFLKIIFASILSAFLVYYVKNFIASKMPTHNIYAWQVLLQLTLSSGSGLLLYLFITALMKMDEFDTIRKKIIIRIFGEPQVATEESNTMLE